MERLAGAFAARSKTFEQRNDAAIMLIQRALPVFARYCDPADGRVNAAISDIRLAADVLAGEATA